MQIDITCKVSRAEREGLYWLGRRQKWLTVVVSRRSEREFDLDIDGKYFYEEQVRLPSRRLDDGSRPGCETWELGALTGKVTLSYTLFSAWFVLACLHEWWGDRQYSRYVDDCGTGDWSFVRDAEVSTIWAMFNSVLEAARGGQSEPVFNHTQGVRIQLHGAI